MTILLFSSLLSLTACKGETAISTPAAAAVQTGIRTAAVEAAMYRPTEEITGSLEPLASVQLGFDVPGRLDALLAHRGDTVGKGAAIAHLDSGIADAQLAQAEAALAGANAQVAGGEAAWGRLQALKDVGGVSTQQYSDGQAQILAARAGLQQAQAAVQLARTHVANHTLRAPIAGTITNAPDNVGVMVGAGTPMFLLEDLSGLQLKGAAPETASWIRAGLAATVISGTPGATGGVPGRVVRVIPALDMATRRLPVEVRVDGVPAGMLAHSYARARIEADAPIEVRRVPRAALVARPDFCVYTDTEGVYTRVPVEVVGEDGDAIDVRADLAVGALVVLNPPNGIAEGTP